MKIFTSLLLFILCTSVFAQDNVSDYLINKGYGEKNTWAIIVANEDYQSYSDGYTENSELAIYQAERFQQMLIKRIGIPKENILFYPDATNTHIKLAIARLQRNFTSDTRLIFYYRGKTYQDDSREGLFLVPVDSDSEETFFMFGLEDLRKRLAVLKTASVDIFIDAITNNTPGTQCILDDGFLKLSQGDSQYNNLVIYKVDATDKEVIVDQSFVASNAKKPEIKVSTPGLHGSQTYESTVLISGNIESDCPIAIVAVSGEEASYQNDGSYTARVNLGEGENNILIEVKNCSGWSRENINITKLSEQPEPVDSKPVFEDTTIVESTGLNQTGKNYALLIGVSTYKDGLMPDLFYPLKDAERIRDVLISQYAFDTSNVIFLQNPEKENIISTLDSLTKVLKPEDSFLMFYAGHGSWDEKNRMGYWLPSDAAARIIDNWIMNSIITGFMSVIPAKHILIIADACFGGSIFRTRAFMPEEEKSIADLYGKLSRKAMTSGDMTEVPDESIFLKYFLQKLVENSENYISSEKLFFEVKPQVERNIDLIPQFGIIKNSGDEGGDYIFFKKKE